MIVKPFVDVFSTGAGSLHCLQTGFLGLGILDCFVELDDANEADDANNTCGPGTCPACATGTNGITAPSIVIPLAEENLSYPRNIEDQRHRRHNIKVEEEAQEIIIF